MNVEVRFKPDNKTIQVKPGSTVLQAAQKARILIRTRCGGNAACLMCKVIVEDAAGLTAAGDNEKRKLGDLVDQSFRLACQARITGPCTVTVPEDPLKAAVRAQLAKQQEEEGLW
ncbi:2Fe-2S iron-sulfur cluster-binding protein [Paenibacillus hodogayensis]|uniref:2Fe-2S iron-sulfur cluster-binding protein n=1 Tax=Paenibacillus hodogayensis TaxID=279208 RepID=A0ABV5W4Q8_9BACL